MKRSYNLVTDVLPAAALPFALSVGVLLFSAVAAGAANLGSSPIPLLNDGVMIRMPVKTLGKTLYFLLDSGFTISSIDAEYQSAVGAPFTEYSAGSPLGTEKDLLVYHCPAMTIAGKVLDLNKITCLDLQMPKYISGQSCDGILGMDFLERNVVSLDFDNNQFCLTHTVSANIKRTFVPIPLTKTPQFYKLDAVLDQARHLSLMVDTGDNSSISLNAESWQEVFGDTQKNVIIATVADAANRIAQSKIGVIGRLQIGNLCYTNLHATFIRNPDSPSHIGLGFFKRHKVTFDFANQMLYLQPGQKFFTSDQEDMSGLHLLREGESTIVYSVDVTSPAYNKGIRPNDVVEIVDGQKASSLTMRDIRRILRSHDGEEVDLQIKRGDHVLDIAFALKKAI